MDFNIPPIGGVEGSGPARRNASAQAAGFSASLHAAVNVSTLPASPPPSVLEDMHVAAGVADELHDLERELHFETSPGGGVVVQVRDLDGNVIRTVAPSQALEIASGAPLGD
jgi:hypothetical protein